MNMNIFGKIKFLLQKPKVIIVIGNGQACAKEAIFQVLKQHFRIGPHPPTTLPFSLAPEILIFETDLKDRKNFEFLIKNSSLPILVVTQVGDIPPDKDYNPPTASEVPAEDRRVAGGLESQPSVRPLFAGEKEKTIEIRKLAKIIPTQGYLVLNFDDETVRGIKNETNLKAKAITFGFQEGADFQATDIKLNTGTNFKLNYQGNVVPIWLEGVFNKEQIYSALAAASVGVIFNLNLVEISQALENYKGLPREGKE